MAKMNGVNMTMRMDPAGKGRMPPSKSNSGSAKMGGVNEFKGGTRQPCPPGDKKPGKAGDGRSF